MDALVLSGGSVKGAFQAGAVAHLLQSGLVPSMIYGISVGALNGAFLADRSGRMVREGRDVDWPRLGAELERFWTERVTRPEDLIRERGVLALAWAVARHRFDGLVSTEPLRRLVHAEVRPENLRASPLKFLVGAVNMVDGEIVYRGADSPRIVDYILASTAVPISMPLVHVEREPHYDGGIRDIAPLGTAINEGATRIVAIVTQPARVGRREIDFRDPLQLVSRTMDIVTNEIVENDLKIVGRFNEVLEQGGSAAGVARYQTIPVLPIRPAEPIRVSLNRFTAEDIRRMLARGRESAARALEEEGGWRA